MKVIVASMFRNSTAYIDRYFDQVDMFRHRVAYRDITEVDFYLAEGDSIDGTGIMLQPHLKANDALFHIDHGGPRWASVDHPERWAQIAYVMRGLMEKVLGADPDIVVWVEADLLWDLDDLYRLYLDAKHDHRAYAPMVFAEGSDRYYDTWGYRVAGAQFNGRPPYWPPNSPGDGRFVKIDSCGSCFVTGNPEGHLSGWDGTWPFRAGGDLWLDPAAHVRHP